MKLEVTIDLEDFMGNFGGDTLNELIQSEIKEQVLKTVKRDQRYKAFIAKKASDLLGKLEV